MPGLMNRQIRDAVLSVSESQREVSKTASYAMAVHETFVRVSTASGAVVVTLPPVTECKGVQYCILLDAANVGTGATNTCTIRHKLDSRRYVGDQRLYRPGHYATYMSDGERWFPQVFNGKAVLENAYFYEQFLTCPQFTTKAGGVHSATAENTMHCASGLVLSYQGIVGQTLTPAWLDPGLDFSGDQTLGDGYELNSGIGTGNYRSYVVGQAGGFFFRVRSSIADVSGLSEYAIGFRKREAYQAAIDNYDEMACMNVQNGVVNIETILNNAATTTTNSTLTWADAATHVVEVQVAQSGLVTYFYDGAASPVNPAFTFDAGEIVIPFVHQLQAADLAGAIALLEVEGGYL